MMDYPPEAEIVDNKMNIQALINLFQGTCCAFLIFYGDKQCLDISRRNVRQNSLMTWRND